MFRKVATAICLALFAIEPIDARRLCPLLCNGSQSALWTPLKIPSTSFVDWWDPRDTPHITLNSSTVSAWAGRINGNVVSQATTANQPGYSSTTMNSLPGMNWDGTATVLSIASISLSPNWSAFIAAAPNNLIGIHNLMDADGTAAPRIAQYLRSNGTVLESIAFNTAVSTFTGSQGTITNNSVNLYYGQNSGISIVTSLNGTLGSPTAITGTPQSGTHLMALGAGTGVFFAGQTGDFFLFNIALSTNTRQCLEGWAAWRYNASTILPAGHPYKSAPPTIKNNCT